LNALFASPIIHRLALVLVVGCGLIDGFCLAGESGIIAEPSTATPTPDAEAVAPEPLDPETLEQRWGIQLLPLRRAAAGHMLDFRYRVTDQEKAAPLFVRQTKPHLIHRASGRVLAVPETAKLGPLRNSDIPQAGRIYWMFFGNPGGLVKVGDRVTVVIGEFRADLTVE
jgi:hypothetical protein